MAERLPTLAEALEMEASDLKGAEQIETADGLEWRLNGHPFAYLSSGRAEFRLDSAIAAAAVRTADTVPSPRGGGWIAFEPADADGHALDRAVAWLGSAHRLVASGR